MAQLSAEVSDLTDGEIKNDREIGFQNFVCAEDVTPWLLSTCYFPLNFSNISMGGVD